MLNPDRVRETVVAEAQLARRMAELQADVAAFLAYNTTQSISYTPATKTFTAANATEIFTATAHGLLADQKARVTNSGGALPAGLVANLDYYLIAVTTNTFQLALTKGGAAVLISTDGTGTHTLNPVPDYIVEDAYGNMANMNFDRTQAANVINSLTQFNNLMTNQAASTGQHLQLLNLLASPLA